MTTPEKKIYDFGQLVTANINQYFPVCDTSTNALKWITLTQLQNLFDANIVKNNGLFYMADYLLTTATATPATMIPLATLDGAVLAAGDIVLRSAATDKINNGLWIVNSVGNATRYSKANTAKTLGKSFTEIRLSNSVADGGEIFYCTDHFPTIDVGDVTFQRVYLSTQSLNSTDSPTFAAITGTGLGTFATFKGGTATSYTETEADGTLHFVDGATVFKDAIVPFLYKGIAGEAALDTFVGGIKNLQFDVGKYTYLENVEAPHDWKQGSEVELHIHWAAKSNLIAGDKIKWSLEFAIANAKIGTNTGVIFCDPATPTVFGTKTITCEYEVPVGGVLAGTYFITSFGSILAADMANIKIAAGFVGTVTRVAKSAGGTDPANGTIFGLNMGIHYEIDTIGSRQIYIK